MQFSLKRTTIQNFDGDSVVVFSTAKDTVNDNNIQQLITLNCFKSEIGSTLLLNLVDGFKAKRVLVVGVKDIPLCAKSYIKALQVVSAVLIETKAKNILIQKVKVNGFSNKWIYNTTARVIQNATYQVQKLGTKVVQSDIDNVVIESNINANDVDELTQGQAIAKGMSLTRHLGDLPANICTPTYLANTAKSLAKEFNLKYEILERSDMDKLGMGSLLSVAKGSSEPPKLISLSYKGNNDAQPIVLVGKGVTFDSGGVSLKPGLKMDEMKYDMCGGASVLGTLLSIAHIKPKINLTVVIPAVENMPAHNALKPGDVVTSMSGQTIEILNTDAEGRLILCDALTYVKKFNPVIVIDVATLTGAVIVALGKHNSGLMSNDQDLVDAIVTASNTSLDGVWQLPLDDEYSKLLESNFADMANIGIGNGEAGTIVAGCFLSKFTKDYRWAHLDIAGVAWVSGTKKGATGRPVPLLTQYVLNQV